MLAQLETKARELGISTCSLTSTATARGFYLAAGYRADDSAPAHSRTGLGERMTRMLD